MFTRPESIESTSNRRVSLSMAQREACVFTGMLSAALLIAGAFMVHVGLIDRSSLAPMLVLSLMLLHAGSALMIRALPQLHRTPDLPGEPHHHFGAANRVTQVRLAMSALLGGLAFAAALGGVNENSAKLLWDPASLQWTLMGFVAVAAMLDAIDGPLARRQRLASALGARFDMEVDALLIMLLSLILWQSGKSGAWILLAGAMRYAFVAAAWRWQWLNAPLPPSSRRQTICVLQVIGLIAGLAPTLHPPWSAVPGALGLVLLTWSFAVDIRWLRHNAR